MIMWLKFVMLFSELLSPTQAMPPHLIVDKPEIFKEDIIRLAQHRDRSVTDLTIAVITCLFFGTYQ
jgi:hypothetical protein